MSKYRVATQCLNCEGTYISQKLEEKKLPEKCKYCNSIKLTGNPEKEKVYFESEE